jgi:arabinose-5-phosphate isomerase
MAGLSRLAEALDDAFAAACRLLAGPNRQIAVTGMGKSGHIARKIAAAFSATGTPAIFVHPSEAGHGDLGMIVRGDVLIVLSNSGNTPDLRPVINHARRQSVPIIGIAAQSGSMVLECADIALPFPRLEEACPANIVPTTSTTMQLALGDALAIAVMGLKGIGQADLHRLHPAGTIGLALTAVSEVMRPPQHLPVVYRQDKMSRVISVMTSGCFGLAGVIETNGHLVGVITDGDLRRHFDVLDVATAGQVMTPSPKTIPPEMLAGDALTFLNDHEITAAFVVNAALAAAPPLGIIHIHDLLRLGLN